MVGHLFWLAVSSIFDLLGSEKGSLSLLRDENFISLSRSNGASKSPSFRTDFKNLHMILVKSAPKKMFWPKNCLTKFTYYLSKKCTQKKVFAKKLFYQLKICLKIGLLVKTFLGCTFYYGHIYIFEISTKRRIFLYPIRPNKRKKVFIS